MAPRMARVRGASTLARKRIIKRLWSLGAEFCGLVRRV
jgi:hypothetical protein